MPDWPHAPCHRLLERGAYIVTSGTLHKQHLFAKPSHLSLLEERLIQLAAHYEWKLQAWAVFSNHYHFVAMSPEQPSTLRNLVSHLHSDTARILNAEDGTPGRRVWFEYRETHLTFEKSYLARLNYVMQNPVKHGLVRVASLYPWCSAGWFESHAAPSFYQRITSLKVDQVQVPDEYEVVWER